MRVFVGDDFAVVAGDEDVTVKDVATVYCLNFHGNVYADDNASVILGPGCADAAIFVSHTARWVDGRY